MVWPFCHQVPLSYLTFIYHDFIRTCYTELCSIGRESARLAIIYYSLSQMCYNGFDIFVYMRVIMPCMGQKPPITQMNLFTMVVNMLITPIVLDSRHLNVSDCPLNCLSCVPDQCLTCTSGFYPEGNTCIGTV